MTKFPPPVPENANHLPLALRAHAVPLAPKPKGKGRLQRASEWTLTFDTETTTDSGQALRFGTYQVRKGEELKEAGMFYRPEVLSPDEIALLTAYAARRELTVRTQEEFIREVFYRVGYDLRATIIGFNLPFDLSRLAVRDGLARKDMRGGFALVLTEDKRRPHLRVKHLSRRVSFIKFGSPYRHRTGRSDRKHGKKRPVRSGFFVDVNTLAHALLSRSFMLASLADHLGTEARKAETDEHGGALSEAYIEYAMQDVQVTWECYTELVKRYHKFGLATPVHRIYSEASLGKSHLEAIGVKPWLEMQPDVQPEIIGTISPTYFGGRAEVRIRRELRQVVLCDFLSMYPTVCTLMGLWQFVIASRTDWHEDTEAVRELLERVTLADLQRPETWRSLTALVQVEPEEDVLPVRAAYETQGSTTIGLNHLTSARPVWFTLADCIASKLLSGKAPKVRRALRFTPGPAQSGLRPIAINGDPEFMVNPYTTDLYKRLIELRQRVKALRDSATGEDRKRLDAAQNALKIAANATGYGIFAETNVDEHPDRAVLFAVHTGTGEPFTVPSRKTEEPGRYFHPLVASLITGAARLMLAIAERLVTDADLEWAFCDTDSMAIARPAGLDEASFYARVDEVVTWFEALNPYEFGGTVLKVEDVNTSLADAKRREALFCYAVSAKRYVLFNVDAQSQPALRKASAHGLGHLRSPYDEAKPVSGIPGPSVPLDKLGVALWQHDLWWTIARAALCGAVTQLPLDYHPDLNRPAVSRYAASTPAIHRWFRRYNDGRSYDEQVKPFGFLNAFTAKGSEQPVAPFGSDAAFDRSTGEPMSAEALKSYAEALVDYHLHPESKFLNGRHFDHGTTRRRHVQASGFVHIGKEANRWEEQFFLGLDPEADVNYGAAPDYLAALAAELRRAAAQVGQRRLADELGISRETLRGLLHNPEERISAGLRTKIESGLLRFWATRNKEHQRMKRAIELARAEVGRRGLRAVAMSLGCDPANLSKMLSGKRRVSESVRDAWESSAKAGSSSFLI